MHKAKDGNTSHDIYDGEFIFWINDCLGSLIMKPTDLIDFGKSFKSVLDVTSIKPFVSAKVVKADE